jgi:DNA-binding NarL/FixJ family response regulator
MSITVSIVEDDSAIREGWAGVINRTPDFRCIAEYGTAEQAMEGIPANPPDVVLMDINLPGLSGIDCVGALRPRLPEVDFIMLTMFDDRDRIFDALRAGAVGYLLKRTTPTALIQAIQQVKAGGSPMSAEVARQITQFFREARPYTKSANPDLETLGDREGQILKMLAAGQHYKEIAAQLDISIDTVRTHIRRIYRKLQVNSRAEAVIKFFGR